MGFVVSFCGKFQSFLLYENFIYLSQTNERCCTVLYIWCWGCDSDDLQLLSGIFLFSCSRKKERAENLISAKMPNFFERFVSSGEYNSQVSCIKINGHQTLTIKLFPSFNYHIMRRHDARAGELD